MKRQIGALHLVLPVLLSLTAPLLADEPREDEELTTTGTIKLKDKPKPAGVSMNVPECFKVHWLLRADDAHYWADWVSECPYTIDVVYVMIGFADHSKRPLGNGVWPMYFVLPGAHQVTRFSAPAEVSGFETVVMHKITTETAEAFAQDRSTVETVRHATATGSGKVGDSGPGRVIPAR